MVDGPVLDGPVANSVVVPSQLPRPHNFLMGLGARDSAVAACLACHESGSCSSWSWFKAPLEAERIHTHRPTDRQRERERVLFSVSVFLLFTLFALLLLLFLFLSSFPLLFRSSA